MFDGFVVGVQKATGRGDKRAREETGRSPRNTEQTPVSAAAAASEGCRQGVVMGRVWELCAVMDRFDSFSQAKLAVSKPVDVVCYRGCRIMRFCIIFPFLYSVTIFSLVRRCCQKHTWFFATQTLKKVVPSKI